MRMIIKPLEKRRQKELISFLEERFGMDSHAFSGFGLITTPKGRVFMVTPGVYEFSETMNVASICLPFARLEGKIKPTSVMLQMFGHLATKNVIELDREDAINFAKGLDLSANRHECSDGYIILKYEGIPLGCGLLRGNEIKNMLPKAKRMTLELL